MTPMMYERVKNSFVEAGLTNGYTVQFLLFSDTSKLTESFMVFRPNGGSNIRNELGAEYHVLVDVIGAKDKRGATAQRVQDIINYVESNPLKDSCLGLLQNMGGIPAPVMTEEGRIVFRLLFSCLYGE